MSWKAVTGKLLALALILSVIAQTNVIKLAKADPYLYGGDVPPDPLTKPPNIQVFSPLNSSVLTSNNISLSFFANKPESPNAVQTVLTYIYYKADWLENTTFLYNYWIESSHYIDNFSYAHTFDEVPDGNHTITICADGMGWYPASGLYIYGFEINGSLTLFFTVETTLPTISVSVQSKTYTTNDVPLNVTLNKSMSEVFYSLDGQQNVTLAGNTTLSGLPNGGHSLIAYAQDNAGYIGASEKIYFSIKPLQATSFPTTIAMTASISLLVVCSIGIALLVYFKKRKH